MAISSIPVGGGENDLDLIELLFISTLAEGQ